MQRAAGYSTMCRASLRRKSCVARCYFAGKVEPSQREEMAKLGSRREIRFVEQGAAPSTEAVKGAG